MANEVAAWWVFLAVVSLLNLGLWALSARWFFRRRDAAPRTYRARWPHLILSAIYVLVCGFRSVLPRADVQRIVLYDSFWSSVFVGRTVATVAELCFVAQWALLLRELSESRGQEFGRRLSYLIVPMITVAEICSWYAVLSTNFIGNVCEQSIWTLTAALVGLSLALMLRDSTPQLRRFLGFGVAVCVGFVLFMSTVDVPMYVTRWLADEAMGKPYLSIFDGVHDVSTRWVVTYDFQQWRDEIAWMSLYFSVAVWISIMLVHAPSHWRAARQSVPPVAPARRRSVDATALS